MGTFGVGPNPYDEDDFTVGSRAIRRAEADLRAAESAAARAIRKLEQLANRPGEPVTDDADGALVIWFQRTFDNTSRVYTYAAVKAGNRWYLTGSAAPQALTWDALMDWLGDNLVGPLWLATTFESAEDE